MADEWWNHLPRLQRGLHQRMLIEYVWASTVPRDEHTEMPDWSPWLSWAEMADQFRCSPEQLRDDARDAAKRGLMAVEEVRGRVRFQVLWQKWPNLKDYTPPLPREVPKKEQAKPASHWFGRRREVGPGETWDFTVPDLPADFRLQKISFRNTGSDEPVAIVGGGPADGGVLVLETEGGTKKSASAKSKTSREKREYNPQHHEDVESGSGLPKLPVALVAMCGRYEIFDEKRIGALVSACQQVAPDCTMEEITLRVRVLGDSYTRNKRVQNVGGLILTQVPKYFASEVYKQSSKKKPVEKAVQKAECGRCDDTGVLGFKADQVSFGDVRREISEGRELCRCRAADLWREMMRDAG